jgi:hypothetical protein
MKYAICNIDAIPLRPKLVVAKNLCIMTYMHYDDMHYEKVDCKPGYLSWTRIEYTSRKHGIVG